ncbi:MAG TPA: hypothetical protein VKM72_35130 [Thermoanaerobaculia bacterium]|nr:hypothetical protein [Thermoanaerobaculia bacterium]
MARNTYPETFAEWRRLVQPLSTNNGDTPHLEGHRTRLEALMTQVEEIEKQQAALTAAKQEASKQLKALVAEGRKVAAFLKAGIRERYGRTAEKLVEFSLQPFRGKKTAKPEEPTEVKPPAPAPTPNA